MASPPPVLEEIPVPTRYLIKADHRLNLEELAPLTDAGMTPYRGIKKLCDAGALGPNRVLGVLDRAGIKFAASERPAV